MMLSIIFILIGTNLLAIYFMLVISKRLQNSRKRYEELADLFRTATTMWAALNDKKSKKKKRTK